MEIYGLEQNNAATLMASSLKSQSIKALFHDAPDETKLEIFSDLCKSIPTSVFLEHENVKKHVKTRVCEIAVDIAYNNELKGRSPQGSTDMIEYFFHNSNWNFDKYAYHLDPDVVEDMLRYLTPWKWKWCLQKKDFLLVSDYQETEDWCELNFNRDIVSKKLPSDKIRKIWQGNKSIVGWEIF